MWRGQLLSNGHTGQSGMMKKFRRRWWLWLHGDVNVPHATTLTLTMMKTVNVLLCECYHSEIKVWPAQANLFSKSEDLVSLMLLKRRGYGGPRPQVPRCLE